MSEEKIETFLAAGADGIKQDMLDYLEELRQRVESGEIAGFAVFGVHSDGLYFGGTAFQSGIAMGEIAASANELFKQIAIGQTKAEELRAAASKH